MNKDRWFKKASDYLASYPDEVPEVHRMELSYEPGYIQVYLSGLDDKEFGYVLFEDDQPPQLILEQ